MLQLGHEVGEERGKRGGRNKGVFFKNVKYRISKNDVTNSKLGNNNNPFFQDAHFFSSIYT